MASYGGAVKYIHTPMHEILQTELYVAVNEFQEIVVSYAGRGTDLRPSDYLTHADGIRILTGGLDSFVASGEKEAVLPLVDEDDVRHGGYRLKGFMLLQSVHPRKLSTRRGEITFDLEEGGPAPSMKLGNIVLSKDGVKVTSDPSYEPPPHGGGVCLSSRDCFLGNGTCSAGHCSCLGAYTGTYCQLYRPEYAAVAMMVKKTQQQQRRGVSAQSIRDGSKQQQQTDINVGPPVPQETSDAPRQDIASTAVEQSSIAAQSTAEQSTASSSIAEGSITSLDGVKDGPLSKADPIVSDSPQSKVDPIVSDSPQSKVDPIVSDISQSKADSIVSDSPQSKVDPIVSAAPEEKKARIPIKLTFSSSRRGVSSDRDGGPPSIVDTVPDDRLMDTIMMVPAVTYDQDGVAILPDIPSGPDTEETLAAVEPINLGLPSKIADTQQPASEETGGGAPSGTGKRRRKRKAQPSSAATGEREEGERQEGERDPQKMREEEMDRLYGEGKPYPEPYPAGKLPNSLVHDRYRRRFNRETFIYSVRFRVGPLGITFDNTKTDSSVVLRLAKGEQSELSDIKEGDRLIAVDHLNVTEASAKISQRLMSTLSWPRVLVFETKALGPDPRDKETALMRRTMHVQVVYPPSLAGHFQIRLSDWGGSSSTSLHTPLHPYLQSQSSDSNSDSDSESRINNNFCPLYRLKAPGDLFACKTDESEEGYEFRLPAAFDEILTKNGSVDAETEEASQLLTILVQKIHHLSPSSHLLVEPRSLAIAKRGDCTFVQKARTVQAGSAQFGIVVNSDNDLIDMPAGKEKTADLKIPFGIAKESEAGLTLLAAKSNEVWAIISEASTSSSSSPLPPAAPVDPSPTRRIPRGRQQATVLKSDSSKPSPAAAASSPATIDPTSMMTDACARLYSLVEDVVDQWPHSVPHMTTRQIVQSGVPSKLRGLTEEGGRMALSGMNGWAFFDYHLAMFGPQELPQGPFRLQMALPPFGCDPNAYTVRIQGAVVAILRGGGCSFGIKVINAQKLGAKAVVIVNTDDMKTMRLMALPDEVPLITVPCIMVSRRLQFYLEQQLRPYFPIDQHLVSMQPTGIFGEYEKRNQLTLPQRLA